MTAATVAREFAPATAPERRRAHAAATLGSIALGALVVCLVLLGANAASGRSSYVPSGARSFPEWLAGPLAPLGFTPSHAVLEGLVLAICGLYAVVLACLPALPARRVWLAIVLATLAAALAPPLLSGDALGYLGFARLGVLHGLSPYSFTANAAPHDAIYPYLTWRGASAVTTPYGPLFTLASYALVPLGIAGGLWALKLLAALTTLATLALIWRIAARLGSSPKWAVGMYGLNPVVLIFAVAGAHNDTWYGLAVAAAILALLRARESRGALAAVAATALKVSAVMLMPFALIGSTDRRRLLIWLAGGLAVALVASLAVFGVSLDGIAHALLSEQRDVARHSLPNEVSMLFGFAHLPEAIRASFIVAFALAVLAALWGAWRGLPWLDCYAWATLALLAASSWLLPWYAMWVLLPASVSTSRRVKAGALVASAYCVAIKIL
jgi:alpha-1,6-mannosyltransferase